MADDTVPTTDLPPLPPRPANSHKGLYGTILVVAGSRTMSGAAVLCGTAALRGGAGVVRVATPAPAHPVVAAGSPCYLVVPLPVEPDDTLSPAAAAEVIEWGKAASVVAVGPGLRSGDAVRRFVTDIIHGLPDTPVVLDADGLNAVAPFTDAFRSRKGPLVVTPHPKEFSRLTGLSVDDALHRPQEVAVDFARRFGTITLLKGDRTVVTDGRRVYRNTTGNPGMATGGSGDVLTGVVAALIGRKGLDPFDATVLGCYAHGRAGDAAAAELGQTALTAADLVRFLPVAFRELEARGQRP